jgi:hypothetical protein
MKFNRLIALSLACLLSASPILPDFNKEIEDILYSYKLDINKNPYIIPIYFTRKFSDEKTIAVCFLNYKEIVISLEKWNRYDAIGKKNILYHELGHCLLGYSHRNEMYPNDGCPKSIMNFQLLDNMCYIIHKDELLKEYTNNIKL